MKVTDVISGAKRSLIKAGFKVKKHSPEILVVVGVAGVVTSTVMACKATTKAGDILEEHQKDIVNSLYYLKKEKVRAKISERGMY